MRVFANIQSKQRRPLAMVVAASMMMSASTGFSDDKPDKPAVKSAASKSKPKPAAEPSLDDALLKDLDNELLDGAGDLKPSPPTKASDADQDKPSVPGEKPEPTGDRDAADGEDLGSGPEDPLSRVGRQMRRAEELIERLQSPDKTVELQRQIVKDLEQLAQELEKQCQKQGAGKPGNQQTASRKEVKQPGGQKGKEPGKENDGPVKDSTDRLGKNNVQKTDMAEMKNLMKDLWGQLPLRDREQMLQSSPEQFLPKYELLIEKYYKRLAEQQKSQRD